MTGEVKCSKCDCDLSSVHDEDEERAPCPQCGSTARAFSVHLSGVMTVFSSLGAKHRRPGFKRPIMEMFSGKRRGRDGRIVNRDAVIDRLAHRYRERVTTEDGEVIVDKDEGLRQHR